MDKQYLGFDVCNSKIVCCLLSSKPAEPRQFYHDYSFPTFDADSTGLAELFKLIGDRPTIAIAEPTGINYLNIWCHHLIARGVDLYLVDHKRARAYRVGLNLPDKDDCADALALAIYGIDYHEQPRNFVQIRNGKVQQIREMSLRLQHLVRCQSPLINRARQYLVWQFPEVAKTRSPKISDLPPLLWGWLAGLRKSTRYDRLFKATIGYGGISDSLRYNARRYCELLDEETLVERELVKLLQDEQFTLYRKAFEPFGFGLRTEAILLAQIYPFSMFLQDGKPEVKIRKGKQSGKPTKRHLSERRFMKMVGCALVKEESGDKSSKKKHGGGMVRTALWQWVFTRIEPSQRCNSNGDKKTTGQRVNSRIGKQLGDMFDDLTGKGQPARKVRCQIVNKSMRLLFKELVKIFCSNDVE